MSVTTWREDVMTSVYSLAYDYGKRTGTLRMPAFCCTDMRGAIALFQRIDPRVRRIVTIAGVLEDAVYVRKGKTWRANHRGNPA